VGSPVLGAELLISRRLNRVTGAKRGVPLEVSACAWDMMRRPPATQFRLELALAANSSLAIHDQRPGDGRRLQLIK
jgi:hypothetical protein